VRGPLIYLLIGAALPIGLGVSNTIRWLGLGPRRPAEIGGQRVEAEEFTLRDSSGRVRAKLVVRGNSPQLTLYDAAGNPGPPLAAEPVIPGQAPATKSVTEGRRRPRISRPRPASKAESLTRNPFAYSVPQPKTRPQAPPPVPSEQPAGTNFAVQPPLVSSASRVPSGPPTESPNPVSPPVPAEAPAAPNPASLPVLAAAFPPVNLTVLGYVEKRGVAREVAVSDNFEVYVTHEGETFAERFKVVKVAPTVVQALDTYTNQTLQLALSP
jgi:hypothetical protein